MNRLGLQASARRAGLPWQCTDYELVAMLTEEIVRREFGDRGVSARVSSSISGLLDLGASPTSIRNVIRAVAEMKPGLSTPTPTARPHRVRIEDLKARWFAIGSLVTGLPLLAVWLLIHFTGGNV